MSEVETDLSGNVLRIFINRPEFGNSLGPAVMAGLSEALTRAAGDAQVRAVVLSGRGKLFCGGGDVKSWQASKSTPEKNDEDGARFGRASKALMLLLAELPKPTIAMVNGAAAGAGLDLACACDFRYAVAGAKLVCAYTRVGFAPDAGGTWLLPRLIGMSAAKELIFTGDIWTAERGLEAGLVDKVCAAGDLERETMAFAARLAAGPTVAIAQSKRLLREGMLRDLDAQIDAEHQAAKVCRRSRDHAEGLKAANERRAPAFTGE